MTERLSKNDRFDSADLARPVLPGSIGFWYDDVDDPYPHMVTLWLGAGWTLVRCNDQVWLRDPTDEVAFEGHEWASQALP